MKQFWPAPAMVLVGILCFLSFQIGRKYERNYWTAAIVEFAHDNYQLVNWPKK